MSKGFFVPNSKSGDFVANQKTSEGSYKWDQAAGEIGLAQQSALQNINKQYSTTINNAYNNYLLANRGIQGSMMGQNYKEAYGQIMQQQLVASIAETNMNATNLRAQIAQQGNAQLGTLEEAYKKEVSNLDRVAYSAKDYQSYLSGLVNKDDMSTKFFTEEESKTSIDFMYDRVFDAQPQNFVDEKGNQALTYTEWVNLNLKNNEADIAWSNWLLGLGGLSQFRKGVKEKGIRPL